MDVELFNEFSMVAKHGNLSEASRELHLTESVLSRHLKALESETGLELFDRSTTPMRLTAVGERFLPLASGVGVAMERVKAFSAAHRRVRIDTVRVRGVVDGVTLPLLRAAKECCEAANPQVSVKIQPHQYQTPFEDIREGRLDVAVEPLSDLIDIHELSHAHLAFEEACVVVEQTDPLAQRSHLGLADLAEMRFTSLRSNRDNGLRKHLQTLCRRLGLEGDVPKCLVLSPADSYDELLLEGLDGCALMLPRNLAERYAREFPDAYALVPLADAAARYDLHAFWRPDAPAHVQAYLRELCAAAG